jgi:PPOX class probable F420-dependent enzyme
VADPVFREFWARRMTGLLTTVRPDGRPHAVAVNAMLELDEGIVLVLASRSSVKVANVRAGDGLVAVSRIDGVRWSSVQGVARVREEPEVVADAERRYAERYRQPRPNPERVIIEIEVHSVLGRL